METVYVGNGVSVVAAMPQYRVQRLDSGRWAVYNRSGGPTIARGFTKAQALANFSDWYNG